MDYLRILKRAWEITWRYRALWIFGIILALTAGGGGWNGGSGGSTGDRNVEITPPHISPELWLALIAVAIAVICVLFLLAIIATIARYIALAALIRMVNDHEETGQKYNVLQGLRLGCSRAALRMFLIALLIGAPLAVLSFTMLLISLSPLLVWVVTSETALLVIGTIAAIGLFFVSLLLIIVASAVVDLLFQFFWRACALEGLGVLDAIRSGFALVWRHLKDVAIMWVIMVGLRVGLTIALIPVTIILVVVGALLGALPGLIVWAIARMLFTEAVPWVLAGLVALPVLVLVVAIPSIFIGGLMEVFTSSVWTLTYQELRALDEGAEEEGEIEEGGKQAADSAPQELPA